MEDYIIPVEVLNLLLKEYLLPFNGVHGLSHWARVREYGLRLSEENGADPAVVSLFSVFHDCRRKNESRDDGHGKRAADFAFSLKGDILNISGRQFDSLYYACEYHTAGLTDGNITVQTCWDSDRLDLNRVGIKTDPGRLCTESAKNPEILLWASEMAGKRFIPEQVGIWEIQSGKN